MHQLTFSVILINIPNCCLVDYVCVGAVSMAHCVIS